VSVEQQVLVTGAASGIGRAIAEALVAAGTPVLAVDRAADALPDGAAARACDLADPDAIDALVAEARGRVAALVNCAGVPGTHPPARVVAVNLLAPRRLLAGLAGDLGAAGCVVNVASVAAQRSTVPDALVPGLLGLPDDALVAWVAEQALDGTATYDFTKQALVALTLRACAERLGRGPRVVSVSPGPTETPILADFTATMGADRMAASAQLVGRHATAEDVAGVVAFLLSPAARWVNGVDVRVDGGLIGARVATEAAAAVATPTA
jgi:NAD(P)-dependent dehydrogenase (short-subunit alcohol dehydrogenase family)